VRYARAGAQQADAVQVAGVMQWRCADGAAWQQWRRSTAEQAAPGNMRGGVFTAYHAAGGAAGAEAVQCA